jgi:hypothetical protein
MIIFNYYLNYLMSKQIFKSINSKINFYENQLLNQQDNINFSMYPHLRELTLNKIEIYNKLLELIGDKDDMYYQAFYNKYFKDYKLFQEYRWHNLTKTNSFTDMNDFINKIEYYINIDGKHLINEIKIVLDNIKILPVKKEKETKPKTKKKSISATIKKLVWNTNIGEEIGKSKCLCCKSTDITQLSFNCGHIIAEANGGETIVSNLKPICQNCNSSMGTKNMNDFMETLK